MPEGYEKAFDTFTNNLTEVIMYLLIAGAVLKLRKGAPNAVREALRGGGSIASGIESGKRYLSRYTYRTVRDTVPIMGPRVSNMMLRTTLGMPKAKDLATREALKNPAFALQYAAQKGSYTSARDKAVARSIVEGATDQTNQALRRAGIGVIDDAPQRNTAKNLLRLMGFGNTVGPNEPLRPDKSKPKVKVTGTKKSVKRPTSTKALGSALSRNC